MALAELPLHDPKQQPHIAPQQIKVKLRVEYDQLQMYHNQEQKDTYAKLIKTEKELLREIENQKKAMPYEDSCERIQNFICANEEPLMFPRNDCFIGSTLVAIITFNTQMEIKFIQIDHIKVGDIVLSYNLKNKKYLFDINKQNNNNTIRKFAQNQIKHDHDHINDHYNQNDDCNNNFKSDTNFNPNPNNQNIQNNQNINLKTITNININNIIQNTNLNLCLAHVTHIHHSYVNQIAQITLKRDTNSKTNTITNINQNREYNSNINIESQSINDDNNNNNSDNDRILIQCTSDHPIWCVNKEKWCNLSGKLYDNTLNKIIILDKLTIGDKCLDFNGNIFIISKIIYKNNNSNNSFKVYNLTVDGTQTFFANNILVHNKCNCVIL